VIGEYIIFITSLYNSMYYLRASAVKNRAGVGPFA